MILFFNTTSCITKTTETVGNDYFCEKSVRENCNSMASKLCLNTKNVTWQQANQACLRSGGYLTYDWWSVVQKAEKDTVHWLGLYRTFLPTQKSEGYDGVCLAMTKVSQSFYIETDACSTKKYILCKELADNITAVNTTIPTRTDTATVTIDESVFNNDFFLAFVLHGTIVAILAINYVVCKIFRRNRKHQRLNRPAQRFSGEPAESAFEFRNSQEGIESHTSEVFLHDFSVTAETAYDFDHVCDEIPGQVYESILSEHRDSYTEYSIIDILEEEESFSGNEEHGGPSKTKHADLDIDEYLHPF